MDSHKASTGDNGGMLIVAAAILLGAILVSAVLWINNSRNQLTMGQRYKMACLAGGGSWVDSKCLPRPKGQQP